MGSSDATHTGRLHRLRMAFVERFAPKMRVLNLCSIALATTLAIVILVTLSSVIATESHSSMVGEEYQICKDAVDDLQEASDFLTDEVRGFVSTGRRSRMDNYLVELTVNDRRGKALDILREHTSNPEALEALVAARTYSDSLAKTELYAIRLMCEALGKEDVPEQVAAIELDDADKALSPSEQKSRAYPLVYGEDYTATKLEIRDRVQASSALLLGAFQQAIQQDSQTLEVLIFRMHVSVILLLLVVAVMGVSTVLFLLYPMSLHAESIRNDEALRNIGAAELRSLTTVYNEMYTANHDLTNILDFEAHNDALTGVLNRGSFITLLTEHKCNSTLLLVDIDFFKQFNDEWGHEMGDAILVEVSATLFSFFRSTDFVFRIGGDEFAVIMTNTDPTLRDVIAQKVEGVADFLRSEANGLPAATISVGVAFGNDQCTDQRLFQEADAALYEAKRRGRNGHVFFHEIEHEQAAEILEELAAEKAG